MRALPIPPVDWTQLLSYGLIMTQVTATPADVELATRLLQSVLGLSRQLRLTRGSTALSAAKLLVLGMLRDDGSATAAGLAAVLHIQPQSLTRLLAGLQADGLISRQRDPADGRQSLIRLTSAGAQALAADLRERRQHLLDAMQRALTPAERHVLDVAGDLMNQVAAEILPVASPRAPGREEPA